MNKELGCVGAFIISVIIFSSLTPFAYAIKDEQKALEFYTTRDISKSCADDVWFDELDWDEYQSLISQTVQRIDGWGNDMLAAQEAALEKSGTGTNPDVLEAKHIFLPGVDGSPALVYDIMKKKAVNPDTVCHLNNLFSGGRISYATSLVDQLRYCPTEGAAPCEKTLTSSAQEDMDYFRDDAVEINETNIEDKSRAISDIVGESAPNAIVESSDAQFILNSDTNLFFPQTRVDFLNFIRSWNKVDLSIGIMNGLAMAGGAVQIFGGMKFAAASKGGWSNMFKSFGKGLWERRFIKAAQKNVLEFKSSSTAGKAVENSLDVCRKLELKTVSKETLDAAKTNSKILDNLRDFFGSLKSQLRGIAYSSTDDMIKEIGPVTESAYKELMATGGVLKKFDTITDGSDGATELIKIAEKVSKKSGLTLTEAKSILVAKTGESGSKAVKIIVAEGETLERMGKVRNARNTVNNAKSAGAWETALHNTDDAIDGFKAPSSDGLLWDTLNGYKEQGTLFKQGPGAIINYFLSVEKGGIIGGLLRLTQISQSLFMGTLWLRNNALVDPQFEYPGVVEFELSNELENIADNRQEFHYLDVKKSAGFPEFGKFLNGMIDQFFVAFGLADSPSTTSDIQTKVANIQDIVFIMDQDALIEGSEERATNLILSDATGDDRYWTFLSSFPASTLIYNFEHPKGYTPDGISALNLHLSNINIYAIASEATDYFSSPLDPTLPILRSFRNSVGLMTLLGMAPIGASVLPVGLGTAGWGIFVGITVGTIVHFAPKVVDGFATGFEQMFDAKEIDEDKLCKNYFTVDDRNAIRIFKTVRAVTAGISAVTSISTGPKPPSPALFIGFAADITQLLFGYMESNKIERITNDLKTCLDTEYEVVSFKDVPSMEELEQSSNDFLKPIQAEALSIFNILSPELNSQFDNLAESMKMQVMHLQVNAKDTPLTSVIGKEVYNVHFKDSDIKWFQDAGCNIDLCQQSGAGYVCMTQNGYWLLNASGDMIIEGPQALSMRMNLLEGYMGLVQRVIEVKKKSGKFLEIYPDEVKISNDCVEESFVNLTGTKSLPQDYQEDAISDVFGTLDAIYTPNAQIWFDGNDVAVQFFEETACSNGVTYGAREIFRFTNSHIQTYRDVGGKIEVLTEDDQAMCEFELGSKGAIGFSNGMIRSGFAQSEVDFSGVYHVFIYNLVTLDKSQVSSYSFEACEVDGTQGIRPVIETDDPYEEEQWNALFGGMCYVDVEGQDNSSVHFDGDTVTVVDPEGVAKTYEILYYDPSCGGGLGGYRVIDENDDETCLFMNMGPNGQPQINVNAQAPVPLLWATGLGGSFMYDPSTGRISIKNEFPFALNPNFALYGAGGLGMMTPTLPPWGGNVRDTGEISTGPTNVLAALPWLPEGFALALFIVALAGGLLFIRIRFKREEP